MLTKNILHSYSHVFLLAAIFLNVYISINETTDEENRLARKKIAVDRILVVPSHVYEFGARLTQALVVLYVTNSVT